MNGVTSKITRRYQPIGADLSLEAEIPLLNLHVGAVIIQCHSECVKRPLCITADVSSVWVREGVSTGLIRPRIFEAHTGQGISQIKWWQAGKAGHVPRGRKVIRRSSGCPERSAAV